MQVKVTRPAEIGSAQNQMPTMLSMINTATNPWQLAIPISELVTLPAASRLMQSIEKIRVGLAGSVQGVAEADIVEILAEPFDKTSPLDLQVLESLMTAGRQQPIWTEVEAEDLVAITWWRIKLCVLKADGRVPSTPEGNKLLDKAKKRFENFVAKLIRLGKWVEGEGRQRMTPTTLFLNNSCLEPCTRRGVMGWIGKPSSSLFSG
jgi:hypothetical protein